MFLQHYGISSTSRVSRRHVFVLRGRNERLSPILIYDSAPVWGCAAGVAGSVPGRDRASMAS